MNWKKAVGCHMEEQQKAQNELRGGAGTLQGEALELRTCVHAWGISGTYPSLILPPLG